MINFKKNLKYNIKKKPISYKKEFDSLKSLIKIAIKLNNKLYKPVIEILYYNFDNKVKLYSRYNNYSNRKLKINR